MNNLKSFKGELERGCGKMDREEIYLGDEKGCIFKCNKTMLCKRCKAKLSLLTDIEKMIREKINAIDEDNWGWIVQLDSLDEIHTELLSGFGISEDTQSKFKASKEKK